MRLATLLCVFALASATESLAQEKSCSVGPGAPLGIRSYTCASCGVEKGDGSAPVYFFGAEPVITEGVTGSPFQPGDVITTMNGKPITTKEAAQQFAFPAPGRHIVGLRRWQDGALWLYTQHVVVTDDCRFGSSPEMQMQRVVGGKGEVMVKAPVVDPTSQIGFAVTCTPACTRVTAKDGRTFWQHEGYPAVVAVRSQSPAATAGLKIGDLIAEVNGTSVTEEAGSRTLQLYAASPLRRRECIKCEVLTLKMVVIRDGERRAMTLYLEPPTGE